MSSILRSTFSDEIPEKTTFDSDHRSPTHFRKFQDFDLQSDSNIGKNIFTQTDLNIGGKYFISNMPVRGKRWADDITISNALYYCKDDA